MLLSKIDETIAEATVRIGCRVIDELNDLSNVVYCRVELNIRHAMAIDGRATAWLAQEIIELALCCILQSLHIIFFRDGVHSRVGVDTGNKLIMLNEHFDIMIVVVTIVAVTDHLIDQVRVVFR